jgi:hypothetical protein
LPPQLTAERVVIHEPPRPILPFALHPNVIEDEDIANMMLNANLYCFAAFADKHTGTIYNDLTGTFPFMSLEGNVCFLVVYHYETNAILALPISGFSDDIIFRAYKEIYEMIESKGFVIRFNVMDNQASKVIKQFLTPKQCELMLVEPNNHRVNAAERAIQTFKDHFVSALATTDSDFPLQLWDRLTQHVETTLNLLRPSRIDPTKSAYEALHGPYDWNRFPLAPPGCKAVIYEAPESRTSWGSRGTDAWYLGPSLDHYRCNHFFVPETRAYRISGSAELFPQHCQVPFLLWNEHLQEVVDELVTTLQEMNPTKRTGVLTNIIKKIDTSCRDNDTRTITAPAHQWMLPDGDIQHHPYIHPAPSSEQRVDEAREEQRVDHSVTRITDTPPIITAPNLTAPRQLKKTARTHSRITRNNIPGSTPPIINNGKHRRMEAPTTPDEPTISPRWSKRKVGNTSPQKVRFFPIEGGVRSRNMISQEAINFLTECVWENSPDLYTPTKLRPINGTTSTFDFQQVAMPMVHPTTG